MSEREMSQRAAMRAIHALLQRVRWKPPKDTQHLAKRKAMGHLPENATMDDYNALVVAILNVGKNLVYRYSFGARDYYAVSGQAKGLPWLVIFDRDGIMETAFPPNDLATYLEKRGIGGGIWRSWSRESLSKPDPPRIRVPCRLRTD